VKRFACSLAIALAVSAPAVRAAESSARILSSVSAVAPGESFLVGVRIDMPDGWHTYWKNPGDSGARPRFEWRVPAGLAMEPLPWPAPERFGEPPIVSYGYENEAWFLWRARWDGPPPGSGRIEISLSAEWLICKDVCIPVFQDAALELSAGRAAQASAEAARLRSMVSTLPGRVPAESVEVRIEDGRLMIFPSGLEREEEAAFYPFDPLLIDHSAPQRIAERGGRNALAIPLAEEGADPARRLDGVLVRGGRAVLIP
jgi:DsbC/DsbD-like thiol-disulfide interchange protein